MRVVVGGTINHFTVGYNDASHEPAVLLNYTGDTQSQARAGGVARCVMDGLLCKPERPICVAVDRC